MRHDLTSTTAKPITNGPSYTTRWDVTWDHVGKSPADLFTYDGPHTCEAGLCLLRRSWDQLAPHGVYVIKDVSNTDMDRYPGIFDQTAAWVSYVWIPVKEPRAPADENLVILRHRG